MVQLVERPDVPASARAAVPEDAKTTAGQERLFDQLRALRTKLARERGVPPYVIFADRTLRAMASIRPRDTAGFLSVPGVGVHKAELYATVFLEAVRAAADEQ
jgi:ATP-dependent DNA helicase RecQ